jgi:hypothetical protein
MLLICHFLILVLLTLNNDFVRYLIINIIYLKNKNMIKIYLNLKVC